MSGPRLKWTDNAVRSWVRFHGIRLCVEPVSGGFGWEIGGFLREGVTNTAEQAKLEAEQALRDHVRFLSARAARELGEE